MAEAVYRSSHKLAISIAIALIIGAHGVPLFQQNAWRRTWPVLKWVMYKNSRPAGPVSIFDRRLMARSAGGAEEEVTSGLLGLGSFTMTRMYVRPLLAGDSAVAHRLLARLSEGRDDPFVELRLEGQKVSIAKGGLVTQDLPAMSYRVPAPDPR